MPRDLGDVLHLFAPELGTAVAGAGEPAPPLVGVAFAHPDPVQSALLWNLAVEIGRQQARVGVVAPGALLGAAFGRDALGVAVERVEAGPAAVASAAEQMLRRIEARERALVFGAFDTSWLAKSTEWSALLRWSLVFARPDERSLRDCAEALAAIATESPQARLGVTVYGVRNRTEARDCFEHLALGVERRFGCPLTSYGVLIDDVHLSRSIVTGRPIGLASPQSGAARALADVASLVLADV
jgi:hypothetical protein